MASNIRAFEAGLRRYHRETLPQRLKDQVDGLALGVGASLMEDTPVVSGRMKGNWQLGIGQPPTGDVERTDTTAAGTVGQTLAEEARKLQPRRDPFSIIWWHNGLEYAVHVNDGTERQRAQRIVERTAERFRRTAGGIR